MTASLEDTGPDGVKLAPSRTLLTGLRRIRIFAAPSSVSGERNSDEQDYLWQGTVLRRVSWARQWKWSRQ